MKYRVNFQIVPARLEEVEILVLCAWCPKYGREAKVLKPGVYDADRRCSHGICKECKEIEFKQYKTLKEGK